MLHHSSHKKAVPATSLIVACLMQIRLYFPQLGHPGFGIIRALVRDSYDSGLEPDTQTFLDSDGLIGQVLRNQTSTALEVGAALLQASPC